MVLYLVLHVVEHFEMNVLICQNFHHTILWNESKVAVLVEHLLGNTVSYMSIFVNRKWKWKSNVLSNCCLHLPNYTKNSLPAIIFFFCFDPRTMFSNSLALNSHQYDNIINYWTIWIHLVQLKLKEIYSLNRTTAC